jgi:glycosidase
MLQSVLSPQVQAVLDAAENAAQSGVQPPFPSPADWRDQWIYFLMVDRFNNPSAPPIDPQYDDPNCNVFQGGNFAGIQQQLPYIKQLGAGAIWMTPVLKNCQYDAGSYHGYGIQDFLQAEPRFASVSANADQELRSLVDAIHAQGMYVIFDIVLNHAGDVFAYSCQPGDSQCQSTQGSEATFSNSPMPILWRDATGAARIDWPVIENVAGLPPDGGVWPVELQHNASFRRQGAAIGDSIVGDFDSLKQFQTPTADVQNAFTLIYQRVIAQYDVDGFRIDTFKYLPPDFATQFCNSIREFCMSIGKKNFFIYGEVFDTNEADIASFIGTKGTLSTTGIVGADAVLDYPLVFTLPGVAKGLAAPSTLAAMYQLRAQDESGIFNVHGDPGQFLVTFLDNHDLKQRFYYTAPPNPDQFDDQVTLAVASLFGLQGVPCLYYGTEQGLHGAGTDAAVREALWGKPGGGFNTSAPFYQAIQAIATVRSQQPALRYGRQYMRPISGDGQSFGTSPYSPGVFAFSRILNDQEVVVAANPDTAATHSVFVIADQSLNPAGTVFRVLYSNKSAPQAPLAVANRAAGTVNVVEVDGSITSGPLSVLSVTLQPMEVQILGV